MPKVRKKAKAAPKDLQGLLIQDAEKEYCSMESKNWSKEWFNLVGRLFCNDLKFQELYIQLCGGNGVSGLYGGYIQNITVEDARTLTIELSDHSDENNDHYSIEMWTDGNHIWIKYL